MTVFKNTSSYTPYGAELFNLTLDPMCFMMNTFAMGDFIASAPVIKYMVDKWYTKPESYIVAAKKAFWPLLPFIPEANLRNYDDKDSWGVPKGFAIGIINKKVEAGGITRLTPKHIHLAEFASLMLADRLIAKEHLNYVPLPKVDVSKFGVDFTKAVILITSYRDVTRMWQSDHILGVAEWVKDKGYTPVFIGKTDMDAHVRAAVIPKTSLPDDISSYGIDLRNQTTIQELASIFAESKAVCGLDSGPIHLAGTTSIPIICGYTSVSPEYRIPYRTEGVTYPIVPSIPCIGCESRWTSNLWNYENCFLKTVECCNQMTSNRFIQVLSAILP